MPFMSVVSIKDFLLAGNKLGDNTSDSVASEFVARRNGPDTEAVRERR